MIFRVQKSFTTEDTESTEEDTQSNLLYGDWILRAVTGVLSEPARSYLSGNRHVVYCFQTLLPRFARDAVVLSWTSLISAFPARRISWRQSKNQM
jgi:hypothetical protein